MLLKDEKRKRKRTTLQSFCITRRDATVKNGPLLKGCFSMPCESVEGNIIQVFAFAELRSGSILEYITCTTRLSEQRKEKQNILEVVRQSQLTAFFVFFSPRSGCSKPRSALIHDWKG